MERLAKDDGVTVFLTTQYLEEADALADRLAIIDNGRIVAEGTPDELKAEIGSARVEAVPADPTRAEDVDAVLERHGDSLTEVVRALDAQGIEVAHLQVHAPTLDDVFLAKTGPLAGGRRGRGGRGRPERHGARERVSGATLDQVRELSRRSVIRTLRQPAQIVPSMLFPLFLLAINTAGLDAATNLPGFPTDSYLTFALAIPFIQAGIFAVSGAGGRPGARHRDRLPRTGSRSRR